MKRSIIAISIISLTVFPLLVVADSFTYRQPIHGTKASTGIRYPDITEDVEDKSSYLCNEEIPEYALNQYSRSFRDDQAMELTGELSYEEFVAQQDSMYPSELTSFNLDDSSKPSNRENGSYRAFLKEFNIKQYLANPSFIKTYQVMVNGVVYYTFNTNGNGDSYYFEQYGEVDSQSFDYNELYGFDYILHNNRWDTKFCIDPESQLYLDLFGS
jgi:hypothetical protein